MCDHCGGSHPTEKLFNQQRKEKGYKKPPFNPYNSNNKCNECNSQKPNACFKCGPEDHFIANSPKPDTLDKKLTRTWKSLKIVRIDQRK